MAKIVTMSGRAGIRVDWSTRAHFVAASEVGKGGLRHVVGDRPVMAKEFLAGFARRLGAPPRRVPEWLARLVAGRYAVRFLTASTRTSNARFRSEVGWSPRYPSYEEGLDRVVAAWNERGSTPLERRR